MFVQVMAVREVHLFGVRSIFLRVDQMAVMVAEVAMLSLKQAVIKTRCRNCIYVSAYLQSMANQAVEEKCMVVWVKMS